MVRGHIVLGVEADVVSGSGEASKWVGNLRGGNKEKEWRGENL